MRPSGGKLDNLPPRQCGHLLWITLRDRVKDAQPQHATAVLSVGIDVVILCDEEACITLTTEDKDALDVVEEVLVEVLQRGNRTLQFTSLECHDSDYVKGKGLLKAVARKKVCAQSKNVKKSI